MIVPMKKAAVITQSKDRESVLRTVRTLGALHVTHEQPPKGADMESLRTDIALIDEALAVLPKVIKCEAGATPEKYADSGYWRVAAEHVRNLHSRLKQLEQYSQTIKRQIEEWEPWGDFDPAQIESLEQKGVYVRLYRIPAKEMRRFPADIIVKKVNVSGGAAYCVVISRTPVELPFKPLSLPRKRLSSLRGRLEADGVVMDQIREGLKACSGFKCRFLDIRKDLTDKLDFIAVQNGMGASDTIAYVTGYVPFDAVDRLRETAAKEHWGLLVTDPPEGETVPTLIRNPRWIQLIKPVFDMIKTFPGYHEIDISFWFLIFFSIFFGILIGDAGYGLVFFLLTLFGHRKAGKNVADRSPFFLMYLLSSCAVIWGVLSGTFFGQAWLPETVRPLIPALRSDRSIQTLCFLLGGIHLSVAHMWRCIRKFPSLSALSELGWISILWGAYFLAKMLLLGDTLPYYARWLFIAGAALVVLFTKPMKNVLKGIGAGVGGLLLNFISSFTDIVSYIRLFAVGMATVAVADAFNGMAMGVGYGSVIAGIGSSLILVLGHTLNIILGAMAILVHGVRLNMLEFSGHLNLEWSGVPYTPFQESEQTTVNK